MKIGDVHIRNDGTASFYKRIDDMDLMGDHSMMNMGVKLTFNGGYSIFQEVGCGAVSEMTCGA